MHVSNAALKRQIAREGARWGLSPLERDGVVYVVETTSRAVVSDGVGYLESKEAIVCGLSDEMNAWTGVLASRHGRRRMDALERIEEREAAKNAQLRKAYEEKIEQWYDRFRSFGRTSVQSPGLILGR